MRNFAYHKPATVAEAAALAAQGDARALAGGMTILPTMKQRLAAPSALVDLSAIAELSGIVESGDALEIGATTRHAEVAASATVRAKIPALARLAESIGDPQVRNRGTIGGSAANNDPAADYPAAILGLGATVKTNKREIVADQFFAGLFATTLAEDEIITGFRFPIPKRAGYAKFPQPASRYALVGVFVAQTVNGARVAVTGAGGEGVFRVAALEKALGDDFSATAIEGIKIDAAGLLGDMHGSPQYRAHLISVLAKRALAAD